ncbi:hypothetical protein RRG08_038518 [Elysia crispata]|uniref:Uncharacterized protein n=1 Tax=Elysia crispata TaxID=231223 RepID=A0AAE1DYK4_9GAST|nr:hypothetical protein RRG08_038518 [Elysia crispata]
MKHQIHLWVRKEGHNPQEKKRCKNQFRPTQSVLLSSPSVMFDLSGTKRKEKTKKYNCITELRSNEPGKEILTQEVKLKAHGITTRIPGATPSQSAVKDYVAIFIRRGSHHQKDLKCQGAWMSQKQLDTTQPDTRPGQQRQPSGGDDYNRTDKKRYYENH